MGSVDIAVCGPCWNSPGPVAGAVGVSFELLPFRCVPGSERGPEQGDVPCSAEGSVGSCVLNWVRVVLASHHSCLEAFGSRPSDWGWPLVVLEAADTLIWSAAAAAGPKLHHLLLLLLLLILQHHLGIHDGGC